MAAKSFRINATATARFKNVMISAKTKKEAEEKFRKIYAAAFPFELEFRGVNAVSGKEDAAYSFESPMPIELWDRMDRYEYYESLGYAVARAEPSKGKYLYSRKEKLVEDYVRRLAGISGDDYAKEYYPKNALLGNDDRNKLREMLIKSILDDAKNYAESLGEKFSEREIRPMIESALSQMPRAIDNLAAANRKALDSILKRFAKEYKKQSEVSAAAVDEFLRKQGIRLPKKEIARMVRRLLHQP